MIGLNFYKRKSNLLFNIFLITIFFNICFPKAGIKVKGIPLTVGNICLGILIISFILKTLINNKLKLNKTSYILLFSSGYFLTRFLIVLFSSKNNFIDIFQYIIPLVIYPIIFIIGVNIIDTKEKLEKILKIIVWGFFFIATYGLLQYILGIDTIAIPGITVNWSDYSEFGTYWYLRKNNGVSEYSKIFSTYQNGNLLGVNLILIYPIVYEYLSINKKIKMRIISLIMFILVIFLTLSRSCWLGLVIFILSRIVLYKPRRIIECFNKILSIMLLLVGMIIMLKAFPSVLSRLTNTGLMGLISMSGRSEGFINIIMSTIENNSIIPIIIGPYGLYNYYGIAYEMTILAVWKVGGIIGVALWMWSIFINLRKISYKNKVSCAAKLGVIIWFIVALIEGAFWLPPTAINLWSVICIIVVSNYNFDSFRGGYI